MNIRKPTDYSILFSELHRLMAEQLSQMNLYICERPILRLMAFLSAICVCGRFTRPMKNPLKS